MHIQSAEQVSLILHMYALVITAMKQSVLVQLVAETFCLRASLKIKFAAAGVLKQRKHFF